MSEWHVTNADQANTQSSAEIEPVRLFQRHKGLAKPYNILTLKGITLQALRTKSVYTMPSRHKRTAQKAKISPAEWVLEDSYPRDRYCIYKILF